MSVHWKNLKYLIKHKWYVFRACLKYGVPLHRAIIHDWSKFLPTEWSGYANSFYGKERTPEVRLAFDYAWNHHQKANKHHWNYWVMIKDGPRMEALEMPETYVREMVADWTGAGMAINGKNEVKEWYEKMANQMLLHPNTRRRVHELLGIPVPQEFSITATFEVK